GTPEEEIARVIAEARELVRKSGGNSLLPRLREAEAQLAGRNDRDLLQAGLREGGAMYPALGAPAPAQRLARERAAWTAPAAVARSRSARSSAAIAARPSNATARNAVQRIRRTSTSAATAALNCRRLGG